MEERSQGQTRPRAMASKAIAVTVVALSMLGCQREERDLRLDPQCQPRSTKLR